MDEFERLMQNFEPEHREIQAVHVKPGKDQAWRAVAALINAITVCGVITWAGWVCMEIGKWVAG